jgi:MFS family permease
LIQLFFFGVSFSSKLLKPDTLGFTTCSYRLLLATMGAEEQPDTHNATDTYMLGDENDSTHNDFEQIRKSFRFWAIIIGLGITLWLAALENSVLTTAAPIILADIPMRDDWVWLTNAFFLGSAAFQPLLGQLSNLFGRRPLTLGVVALFIVGSGICGGATSSAELIAGRAVQGIGSGGITVALDTVVSDLVPLRYRGNYIAVILLIYSVGTTTGALIGGLIVDNVSWRWCFWINLPIGGVSLAMTAMFLHVQHRRDTHWLERLKRVDVVGNVILMGGTTSMLIAIAYAGTRYSWESWQTLVPLLLGFAAMFLFAVFESSASLGLASIAPREPVIPVRMFPTITSVIIAVNTFLYTAVVYWAIFFTPVYFQSVLLTSPTRAGINIIPISLLGIPAAAAAGAAITKWGRYKAIHILGFVLFTIGMGLWTLLDENTPTGKCMHTPVED